MAAAKDRLPVGSAPERHFLGWDGAMVPRAAEWIVARAYEVAQGVADLGGWALITPGARAGRLLLGALVDECGARGAVLVPPVMTTPGEAFEAVLGVPRDMMLRKPAGPMARRLGWIEAVRGAEVETVAALMRATEGNAREIREIDTRGVASMLARVHAELGGQGLRFADIADYAAEAGGAAEGARWRAASAIEEMYTRTLDEWNLRDPVDERLKRLGEPGEEARVPDGPVVLVGVPELPRIARMAIEQSGRETYALVHAPAAETSSFDSFGCVLTTAWAERELPIEDHELVFAEDARDQVERALASITDTAPQPDPSSVVIGLADESLASLVREQGAMVTSTAFRSATGIDPLRTRPARVLELARALLERRTFTDLMALARHPDVERLIDREHRRSGWLVALDAYWQEQLPLRLRGMPEPREPKERAALDTVRRTVATLLGSDPFDGTTQDHELALSDAGEAVLAILDSLYGHLQTRARDPDGQRVADACVMIAGAIDELKALGMSGPRMSVSGVIALVLAEIDAKTIPETPDGDAIEMVGWLELAHDPSPVAVVVGMNEGAVPSTREIDPILPGSLRRAVGLTGSRERLARDSFLITTIARSRPFVRFVCARRDADGAPLLPSRLLLRCGRAALPERLSRSLGDGDGPSRVVLSRRHVLAARSGFRIAPLIPSVRPERMRVTSFRDYIASPYLFYLRHVRNLEECQTPDVEMDRLIFGSLMHSALETFGHGDAKDDTRERVVRDAVMDALRTLARGRFGSSPRPLVAVQVEHATERLEAWARVQAARATAGWRIAQVEWSPARDTPPVLDTDAGIMPLSGKIDRIDRHPEHGWAILDYKTADTATEPVRTHVRRGEWIDLQLPLYRTLAESLKLEGGLQLGYFQIPRDIADIQINVAPWTEADLASAEDRARNIAARVIRGEFSEVGDARVGGTMGLLCGLDIIMAQDAESAEGSESGEEA